MEHDMKYNFFFSRLDSSEVIFSLRQKEITFYKNSILATYNITKLKLLV